MDELQPRPGCAANHQDGIGADGPPTIVDGDNDQSPSVATAIEGFAFGAERITMQLLGLKNIREAAMFPRDMNRIDERLSEEGY